MLSAPPGEKNAASRGDAAENPMVPVRYRLCRTKRETKDTVTLALEPVAESGCMQFGPGQFNMLYAFGRGESAISISGDPDSQKNLVHTVRAVGGVTRALCGLKRGEVIGVRGPFGSSWPLEASKGMDVVLVAGGIGLAPLRPALYRLLAEREHYGRIVLLYGTRSPADILFRRELEQWRGRFDLEVLVTLDRGDSRWRGEVGVVTQLLHRAPLDFGHTVAYVCGPEIMMRFAVQELDKLGVSSDRTFISMERSMKCATGFCGHCQFGPAFICRDGPVFRYEDVAFWFKQRAV